MFLLLVSCILSPSIVFCILYTFSHFFSFVFISCHLFLNPIFCFLSLELHLLSLEPHLLILYLELHLLTELDHITYFRLLHHQNILPNWRKAPPGAHVSTGSICSSPRLAETMSACRLQPSSRLLSPLGQRWGRKCPGIGVCAYCFPFVSF